MTTARKLAAENARLRALILQARPVTWVETQDVDAAREWTAAAVLALELDADSGPLGLPHELEAPPERGDTVGAALILGLATCCALATAAFLVLR